jgi:hypothetical protein
MADWRRLNGRGAASAWIPRAGAALWLALFVGSCAAPTSTEISGDAEIATSTASNEAIVLFPTLRGPGKSYGGSIRQCLDTEFASKISSSLRVMDTGAFQNAMFPWFEVEQMPKTAQALDRLISRPNVRGRIAALNVRYLVTVASSTDSDTFPGILCGGGPGGAGCFGVMTEETSTKMTAVIWDIVEGEKSGEISATSSGNSFGVAVIVPLLFLAYTEHDACEALAAELSRRLGGSAQ